MNVLNLFNLLCVQEPKQNEIVFIIMLIIPIVVFLIMLYGLISFCEYYWKRNNDEKAKFKFKRGIICIVVSLLVLFVTYLFVAINKDSLYDGCGNSSAIASVFKSLTRLGYIFVLVVLMVKFLVNIFDLLKYRKKDEEKVIKNNYKKKALLCLIIIIIVYLVLILTNIGFNFITQENNDGNWAQCWCK